MIDIFSKIKLTKENRFQNTIVGIIFLGVVSSAIWSFMSPEKDKVILSDSLNESSDIILGDKIEGDTIKGDKTINNKANAKDENNFEEHVFINNLSVITAIVDNDDKVIAFSVTTLDRNFLPEVSVNGSSLNFKLGVVSFDELREELSEPIVYGVCGANWFYYSERYRMGRMGNYQDYIFGINENGLLDFFDEHPGCGYININEEFRDEERMNEFRKNALPNTIIITSPFSNSKELSETFKDFVYGPELTQMNLISKNIKKMNAQSLNESIKKLYPDSNIRKFIDILGEPDFTNLVEKK